MLTEYIPSQQQSTTENEITPSLAKLHRILSKNFLNITGIKAKFKEMVPFFISVAELTLFTGRFFKEVFRRPFEFHEMLRQAYRIGNQSLPLVGVTAFIMGWVMTLQSRPTLVEFGAESWLPSMIAVSIVREIGPVITALICAGRVGSSIGAELASMKVTEQIDAMEVSGINPYKYLVVTRVVAATLMVPILVIFADVIGLYGSYLVINLKSGTSWMLFRNQVETYTYFSDLIPALIKTFFFGFAIAMVGCYKGFYATKGTEGVGFAANSSVVVASFLVFILDFLAVLVSDIFFDL